MAHSSQAGEGGGDNQLSDIVSKHIQMLGYVGHLELKSPSVIRSQSTLPSASPSTSRKKSPSPPRSNMACKDKTPKDPVRSVVDSAPGVSSSRGLTEHVHGMESHVTHEDPFTGELVRFQVIDIVSPSEFYVIKVTNDHVALRKSRDRAVELMKIHFQVKESEDKSKEVEFIVHPTKEQIYGLQDDFSKKWHRVRLLDFDQEQNLALVYFFDNVLRVQFAPLNKLRELPEMCANGEILPVYRCHVADVIPSDGSPIWSRDAHDWFRITLNRKKTWMGLILSMNRKLVYEGPDPIYNLGLLLLGDSHKRKSNDSVNYRMVNSGFGMSIGIGGNSSLLPYVSELMPSFEDYVSYAPILAAIPDYKDGIPELAATSMGRIRLAFVTGPDAIYVHDLSKVVELRAVEYDLEAELFGNNTRALRQDQLSVLQSVAVVLREAGKKESKYFRAVVTKVEKTVEILLVDYGNRMIVSPSQLRPMPEQFSEIPSFVHRTHLKYIQPLDTSKQSLSDEMRRRFVRKLHFIDEEFKATYYPVCPDIPGHAILLEDLDQGIQFDHVVGKWVAEKWSAEAKVAKSIRTNRMLGAHVASYGIDVTLVSTGKIGKDDKGWNIKHLLDYYVDEEEDRFRYGIKLVENARVDKKKYYGKLFSMYDASWENFRKQRLEG